jgi:hypothetical protein
MQAHGSQVPMVSAPALALGPSESNSWPLSSLLVSPESVRAEVAAARVGSPEIPDEELLSLPGFDTCDESDENTQPVLEAARAGLAKAKSTGRALQVLASDGVDFAAVGISIAVNDERAHAVGSVVLDILVESVLESMGPDTLIITTSLRGRIGQLALLLPQDGLAEVGDEKEVLLLDVAPTCLSLLGVDCPDHVAGRSLFESPMQSTQTISMPDEAEDHPSESRTLINAMEEGEFKKLPNQRKRTLVRFLKQRLLDKWNKARMKLDFKSAARTAELMVRFEASQINLWRRAFACQHSGDSDGASKAVQSLLELYPGSPVALLSAALMSESASTEELRTIVDAIDPSTLNLPSVRSTWGRTAIKAGRIDEGLDVLEKIIDTGSPLLMDRVVAASVMRSKGDDARALELLGPVGSGETSPLNWRILRARLLVANGRKEEACSIARSILAAFPLESRAKEILEKNSS